MNERELTPRRALNKSFLKMKPSRAEIERFKSNLYQLINKINSAESEEFHKNLLSDFLKETYYKENHFINTKGRNDLVIHSGKSPNTFVEVIVEVKNPTNISEMVSRKNINKKALQELVLYYLRERITHKNIELKNLVITNINEWFIFDANNFEKIFRENKSFVNKFVEFESGRLTGKKTEFFYKEIAEPFISTVESEIEFTYFDLEYYKKILYKNEKSDDIKLVPLFKLISPEHLLKLPFTNDSNSLDKGFYSELLHIVGLSESKEGNKKIIDRKKEGGRNTASIIENTIIQLDSLDKIERLENPNHFGDTYESRLFNVGLELAITWINRILFLKLLEAQLITYHKGSKSYSFLSSERIKSFDDLNELFFQVLAKKRHERNQDVEKVFKHVPYLNSSLFEPTGLEHASLFISNLKDDRHIPISRSTVLKDDQGKKRVGSLPTLTYLLDFLDAYDFSGEGSEDIQEDNKALINASVLGLIFEKINGYRDGAFFTPGFITMYMCRETIRKSVVDKFNEVKGWSCNDINDLYDKIESRQEANDIINSIRVCDPAVGSGHFLVSALNELISVKNDLKILQDRDKKRLKEYQVEVVNDELIITDEDGELFEYNPTNKESQRVQEALFVEKQSIIENCLFGVDVNQNSVKICRLRLWIELLKNTYYTSNGELETLPNIDINIKCGNSLISRFEIESDLKKAIKKTKWSIDSYRKAVDKYRNAKSKSEKKEMEHLIADIKSDFRSEILSNDPKIIKLRKLSGDVFKMENQHQLFEMSHKDKAAWDNRILRLNEEINKLEIEIDEIKANKIYENSFEWRFEFPEALNELGDFLGFDVVVGNPPYILSRENFDDSIKRYFFDNYNLIHEKPNLYLLFIERSFSLLKENGYFSFIVPNSLTGVESARKVRDFLINRNRIVSLVNLLGETFEGVGVESCILTASKGSAKKEIKYSSVSSKSIDEKEFYSVSADTWRRNRNLIFDITSSPEESEIIEKIKNNSAPLWNFFDIKVGLQAYEKGKGRPQQSEKDVKDHVFDYDHKFDDNTYRYLNGRDVGRYFINWSGQWLRHGEWLSQPKSIQQFSSPRILVREITGNYPRMIIATYLEATYLNNKSIINVLQKTEDYSLVSLLGFLNSKLVSFFHKRQTVKGNRRLFPKLVIRDLQNYPYPRESSSMHLVGKLVSKILIEKAEDSSADTSELENKIDDLVYGMFDLSEKNIQIIESVSEL